MAIYFVLFFFLAGFWVLSYEEHGTRKKRVTICCFLSALLLITIAALRGSTVGTDTASYVEDYEKVVSLSWAELFEYYSDNPGYYALSKIFADYGINIQIWFGFVALLYVGSFTRLIKRFAKDVGFSYILFTTLGLYAFSLAGLKQTMAMAITMWSFYFFFNKKYIRFIALVLLAYVFHTSAVVFLLIIPIRIIKQSRGYYFIIAIVFLMFVYGFDKIINLGLSLLGNEHYVESYIEADEESQGTLTMFFVLFIIQIVSLWYMRRYNLVDKDAKLYFGISFLAVISNIMSLMVASAFRIGLYFCPFSIIMLSNCLSMEENPEIRFRLKLGAALVFLFFFWYTNRDDSSIVPYMFYWQSV